MINCRNEFDKSSYITDMPSYFQIPLFKWNHGNSKKFLGYSTVIIQPTKRLSFQGVLHDMGQGLLVASFKRRDFKKCRSLFSVKLPLVCQFVNTIFLAFQFISALLSNDFHYWQRIFHNSVTENTKVFILASSTWISWVCIFGPIPMYILPPIWCR